MFDLSWRRFVALKRAFFSGNQYESLRGGWLGSSHQWGECLRSRALVQGGVLWVGVCHLHFHHPFQNPFHHPFHHQSLRNSLPPSPTPGTLVTKRQALPPAPGPSAYPGAHQRPSYGSRTFHPQDRREESHPYPPRNSSCQQSFLEKKLLSGTNITF